jgi:hypothetical protein
LVATGFFLEAGLDVLDEDWADIVTTELGGYLWVMIILVFQISLGTKSPPQISSSSPQAAGEQLCKSEFPSP